MSFWHYLSLKRLGLCIAVTLSLFLHGCDSKPPIRSYTVPKYQEEAEEYNPADSDVPEPGTPKFRVLAALAPATAMGNDWFFFKLRPAGGGVSAALSPKAAARHEADFRDFLASLKFTDGKNPTWTVPAGWKLDKPQQGRIATFKMKKSDTLVELTVTRFGGSLLDNVNRWRTNDAGVNPLTELELPKETEVITSADGKKITLVSVLGDGPKGDPKQPPFAPKK